MTEHTCTCTTCNGATFTAPKGYISGTPKQVRDMVHNYAQMLHSPVFGPRLAAQGIKAV